MANGGMYKMKTKKFDDIFYRDKLADEIANSRIEMSGDDHEEGSNLWGVEILVDGALGQFKTQALLDIFTEEGLTEEEYKKDTFKYMDEWTLYIRQDVEEMLNEEMSEHLEEEEFLVLEPGDSGDMWIALQKGDFNVHF
jgi:hypothetical protein